MEENKKPILSMENIQVQFGKRRVLQEVTFSVYPGEFIGVIGPNGAGKSTLLKVILGLLSPSDGSVFIGGKSTTRKGNQLVGYVPQKLYLDPNIPLRGRDLVALGLDGHHWGIPLHQKERKRRVDEMLDAVDAARFADEAVGRLSGGEQQRLLIAQALLSDPQVLLLDEPLSNLDIKSAYEVVELVARIGRERGVAVMLVAHDMNPLLKAMDRVLYLADGKAVMGKVDEVFRKEVLSQLYGYPVDVLHVRGRILVIGGQDSPINEYPLESDHCQTEGSR
ncbi:metal ABC transporter ATP-binding protein [Sporolactobacillus pectinivorans]|uniref:metal ABC transporter ATP-binding protein n=1 Tax=Sporolactobacillus pectinivorans TaxID=1591408 RepID=UPI000C257CD0|nr:metal ABC transporter ATP-binding protein [Sporolactobacillus pectinivorans]